MDEELENISIDELPEASEIKTGAKFHILQDGEDYQVDESLVGTGGGTPQVISNIVKQIVVEQDTTRVDIEVDMNELGSLDYEVEGTTNTYAPFLLYINDIISGYKTQYTVGIETAASMIVGTPNDGRIGSLGTQFGKIEGSISLENNTFHSISLSGFSDGANLHGVATYSNVMTGINNITKLSFVARSPSLIKAGTVIIIYRKGMTAITGAKEINNSGKSITTNKTTNQAIAANTVAAIAWQGMTGDTDIFELTNNEIKILENIKSVTLTVSLRFAVTSGNGALYILKNGVQQNVENVLDKNGTTTTLTIPVEKGDVLSVAMQSTIAITINGESRSKLTVTAVDGIETIIGLSKEEILDDLKVNITTGQEFKTGRVIDGKEEFGKRIDTGALPNATTKQVSTGITNVDYLSCKGSAYSSSVMISLAHVGADVTGFVQCYVDFGADTIVIVPGTDRSSYTKSYVDITYTKK